MDVFFRNTDNSLVSTCYSMQDSGQPTCTV